MSLMFLNVMATSWLPDLREGGWTPKASCYKSKGRRTTSLHTCVKICSLVKPAVVSTATAGLAHNKVWNTWISETDSCCLRWKILPLRGSKFFQVYPHSWLQREHQDNGKIRAGIKNVTLFVCSSLYKHWHVFPFYTVQDVVKKVREQH